MSRFSPLLKELKQLQAGLNATVNRIWSIKLATAAAYQHGHEPGAFLPRRLHLREQEEQLKFERMIHRLNRLISSQFDSTLIAFSSADDVKTVARISRTIRYIHNSFSGEPPLGFTLAKINSALPAYSRN